MTLGEDPLVDAAGTRHAPAGPGARVVCLVPSITELLVDLGLAPGDRPAPAGAPRLVGRTGFCIHPREALRGVPKCGGTKDVNLERIRELVPTHVVVNVEENLRETAEALAGFVPHVVVTHPLGPLDNLPLYRLLGGLFGASGPAGERAEELCAALAREAAETERAAVGRPAEDVLYLVWRDPWIAVAPDTYIARTLALAGLRTLPGEEECAALARERGSSPDAARYPQVDPEAYAGRVSRVLLPSEPYRFRQKHVAELEALVPGARVQLVDGELTSWYGSRAVQGLAYVRALARG